MATNSVGLHGFYTTKDMGPPDEAARRQWVGGNMRRYTPSPPSPPSPPASRVVPAPPPSAVGVPEDGWFPLPWVGQATPPPAPPVLPVPPASAVGVPEDEWFPLPRLRRPVLPPSSVAEQDEWFPLPSVGQATQPPVPPVLPSPPPPPVVHLPPVPSAAAMEEEGESVALPRSGRPAAPGAVEVPAGEWFPPPALMTQPLLATRRRTRPWFKVGLVVAFFGVANSAMLVPSSAANEIAVPGNDLAAVAASLYVMGDNQRDNADDSQADSHPATTD